MIGETTKQHPQNKAKNSLEIEVTLAKTKVDQNITHKWNGVAAIRNKKLRPVRPCEVKLLNSSKVGIPSCNF